MAQEEVFTVIGPNGHEYRIVPVPNTSMFTGILFFTCEGVRVSVEFTDPTPVTVLQKLVRED